MVWEVGALVLLSSVIRPSLTPAYASEREQVWSMHWPASQGTFKLWNGRSPCQGICPECLPSAEALGMGSSRAKERRCEMLTFLLQAGLLQGSRSHTISSLSHKVWHLQQLSSYLLEGSKTLARRSDVGMAYEMEETLKTCLQERLGLFSTITWGSIPGRTYFHSIWYRLFYQTELFR